MCSSGVEGCHIVYGSHILLLGFTFRFPTFLTLKVKLSSGNFAIFYELLLLLFIGSLSCLQRGCYCEEKLGPDRVFLFGPGRRLQLRLGQSVFVGEETWWKIGHPSVTVSNWSSKQINLLFLCRI